MFGRRRRPLLRAAAVGGAGYAMGKRRERVAAEDGDSEDEGSPEQNDSVGLGDEEIEELEKLGSLKERGVLTQQEFDDQKAKILGTS